MEEFHTKNYTSKNRYSPQQVVFISHFPFPISHFSFPTDLHRSPRFILDKIRLSAQLVVLSTKFDYPRNSLY